jgi:hypothetical protein
MPADPFPETSKMLAILACRVHKMCQLVHKMCQLVDDQLVYMPAGRQNYLLMYQLVKCAS